VRTRSNLLRLAAVPILALGLLGTVASPATAAPASTAQRAMALARAVASSKDPSASLAGLSTADQALVKEAVTPVRTDVTMERLATPANAGITPDNFFGSWGLHGTWTAKDIYGISLFSFWQTTTVTSTNGDAITTVTVSDKGEQIFNAGIGWRVAHAAVGSTKNCGWEGRGLAKFYFVFGTGGYDLAHPTNCGQIRMNIDGINKWILTSCDLEYNNYC
jgi:hypothetical protein